MGGVVTIRFHNKRSCVTFPRRDHHLGNMLLLTIRNLPFLLPTLTGHPTDGPPISHSACQCDCFSANMLPILSRLMSCYIVILFVSNLVVYKTHQVYLIHSQCSCHGLIDWTDKVVRRMCMRVTFALQSWPK